jgi:hypothetical protein
MQPVASGKVGTEEVPGLSYTRCRGSVIYDSDRRGSAIRACVASRPIPGRNPIYSVEITSFYRQKHRRAFELGLALVAAQGGTYALRLRPSHAPPSDLSFDLPGLWHSPMHGLPRALILGNQASDIGNSRILCSTCKSLSIATGAEPLVHATPVL